MATTFKRLSRVWSLPNKERQYKNAEKRISKSFNTRTKMGHKSRQDILENLNLERRYQREEERRNGAYRTPEGQFRFMKRKAQENNLPFGISYEGYLTVLLSSCPNGHPGSAMNSVRLIDQDFGGYTLTNITQVCSQCQSKES